GRRVDAGHRLSAGAGCGLRRARGDPHDVRRGSRESLARRVNNCERTMQNAIRRSAVVTALAVVLGGCASYAWTKPDITAGVAARDERSCRTEARDLSMQYAVGGFGVPWGYPPWQRPWGGP